MKWWVEKYVEGCDVCARKKMKRHPKGTLKPIEAPKGPWQVIGVDLITQLPKSNNYDAILTVVDHFSKQVHILPCLTSCSTDDVMDLLYHHVFKLHELPRKIISDWNPQFASKLMQRLYE